MRAIRALAEKNPILINETTFYDGSIHVSQLVRHDDRIALFLSPISPFSSYIQVALGWSNSQIMSAT